MVYQGSRVSLPRGQEMVYQGYKSCFIKVSGVGLLGSGGGVSRGQELVHQVTKIWFIRGPGVGLSAGLRIAFL